MLINNNKKALILVDIQNDFLAGGALAVPGGDAVIAIANQLISQFDLAIATQDWHPQDHLSFASQHAGKAVGNTILLNNKPQTLWPDHCVQHSTGAQLASDLHKENIHHIVTKGSYREVDSYSAFFDNHRLAKTELHNLLKKHGVTDVYIMGLATDYCVKFTALDALSLGYNTYVIVDGCRGVNLKPDDSKLALQALQVAGAHLIYAKDLLK